MRAITYIIALLGAIAMVPGCSDDPDSLTSGDPNDSDDGTDPPAADADPDAPSPNASFGELAVSRARQWVKVEMPYCGGPNGGKDVICGGTCVRGGESKHEDWDDYRSDCSGFVSWAWSLPAPGRTTSTLAPYKTDISAVINITDLKPGDALNGKGHVMLWGGWVDEEEGTALILQESRCGQVATEKTAKFKKVDATTLKISDGRVFRPIRYRNADAITASK